MVDPGASAPVAGGNLILNAMDPDERERLMPRLTRVPLALRMPLEEPNQPVEKVCFPLSGLVSRVAVAVDLRQEVGLVGPEGMTGLAVVLGAGMSPHRLFVQVSGEAWRIEADDLARALDEFPSLRSAALRWAHVCMVQISQTALVNARNTIEERLARWLLMCEDRLGTRLIAITHDFLSLMLNVHRPGVTLALHTLEGAGYIRAERGLVTILDREALIDVAGDGYGVAEREQRRLFGD